MKYNIYSDESSTNGCRYMLIGGLWLTQDVELNVRECLLAIRHHHGLTAEMKWNKVSEKMLVPYQEFVNAVILKQDVYFKCIVIEKSLVDYRTYHNGDKDLGFYKFYFHLISRKLSSEHNYWLYVDERTSRQHEPLPILKRCVNAWWRKKGVYHNLLHSVEAQNSKNDDLAQAADIVLGAIAAAWNATATSPAKIALISHISSMYCRPSLAISTPKSCTKLDIWKWKPYSIPRQNKRALLPSSNELTIR